MTAKLLAVGDVAERQGVDLDAVYEWIGKGELPAVNVGRRSAPRWRVEPEAVEDFKRRRASSPRG